MNVAVQIPDEQLPGGLGSPTISTASDNQLADCLAADLEHVRVNLEPDGEKPTADGLPPKAWKERAQGNRSKQNTLSSLEAAERRIVAARAELERREAERKAEAAQQVKDAKRRLSDLVEGAPENAQRLASRADELLPSVERVRQLVADLEAMAHATGIAPAYSHLTAGTETAAQELGVDQPKLAALPDNLPNRREFEKASAFLAGRHDGFDTRPGLPSDYAKAREIARVLK